MEDQGKFLTKKQEIFVGDQKFEFTQYDRIFKLSRTPHPELAASIKEGKKFKVAKLPCGNCFCCMKDLSLKVKQDICHFCTLQGCTDCVYKEFPFLNKEEGASTFQHGKVCRVCETKFYIKIVIVP